MVVTCDIQFESNPEATYYAGQVITGKLTLTADKAKQVKAVNLKINGSAKTRWKKKDSKRSGDRTYWGQVDYMNTVTCLLAPKANDQAVVIQPGIHTFNFACHIPFNCPSSFEGVNGSIRYVVQVSLQRPWKFDQTFTKGFTVLTIKNLNYDSPLVKLPVKNEVSKSFCCGPCQSDPLQINVQLPQTGYVPGQLIPVNILIVNNTVARINEIRARLVMVIKYFSTSPVNSTSETKTICKLIGDPVLRNCKKSFSYLLPIPATPPTCTTLCSIIQITYRVEVETKIQGFLYANQCIHIPVAIGNVPLRLEDMVVQQQPLPRQLNLQNLENSYDPTASNENTDPWAVITNITPPVYMAAAHMPKGTLTEDVEHEYGEKEFTPKYPVFDVPSPTSLLPPHSDETDGRALPSMLEDPDKSTWL